MEDNNKYTIGKIILKSNLKCIWIYTLFYIFMNILFSFFMKGNNNFYSIVISVLICIVVACFLSIFILYKRLKNLK